MSGLRWHLAALALGCGLLFFFAADSFLSPPDCAAYWCWGESLATDLDFDFRDEFSGFSMPVRYTALTPTGRLANDWPAGSGIALVPWILAGGIAAHAWVAFLVAAAMTLWMQYNPFAARARWLALVAMFAATPLAFYVLFGPFFSHAVSFVLTTAFVVVWERTRAVRRSGSCAWWCVLGIFLGGAGLVRPQNVLLGIIFLAEAPGWRGREMMPRLAQGIGGFLLGIGPLFIIYAMLYGSPFALPKAEEMHWFSPAIGKMLFSDYHGILPWTPVYALAAAGLVVLARRDRGLGVGLILLFLTQFYINSANVVWWSGGSFGNRRLVDSAIVVAYGVAALLEARESVRWRGAVIAATCACAAWTVWLMLAERRLLVPLDRYVPFINSEFPSSMMRVWTEPMETIKSVARGPFNGWRVAASVLLAAGVYALPGAMSRLRRVPPKLLRNGMAAGAGAVILITLAAAVRTPRVDDPELLAILPSETRILWDNYLELAYYEVVRGDFVASEDAARAAIALNDQSESSWFALARALMAQERYASAAEAATRALEINPHHENSKRLLESLRD